MEVKMAELVTNPVPTMDMVRMVNSGTEVNWRALYFSARRVVLLAAIRLSNRRLLPRRADCLLVKAGSGALTLGQPNCRRAGRFREHTLTCTYNDLASVRARRLNNIRRKLPAIIAEPVVAI